MLIPPRKTASRLGLLRLKSGSTIHHLVGSTWKHGPDMQMTLSPVSRQKWEMPIHRPRTTLPHGPQRQRNGLIVLHSAE